MKRITVPVEAIEQRLIRTGLKVHRLVGSALGHFGWFGCTVTGTTEPAVAAPVLAVVVRPVDDALMPARELAEHGYVDADIPPELRTGRTPQYSVQRRRVIEDAGAFFAWLAE